MQKLTYRHTIYASYLAYIVQAVINNLAPLLFLIFRDEFGISLEKITLLITVNFLIQLTVDLLSAKWVDRIGYRAGMIAAHVFSAAGIAGLAVFPFCLADAYAGLLLSVGLYAVGGGLLEVLVSPVVEACPTDNKASVMSLLHSFYCWGTVLVIVLSTLFLQAAGRGSWRVLTWAWALLPLANAFVFSRVPLATLTENGESLPVRKLLAQKTFWLFFVLIIMAGASEQAMSQWASTFAEMGLGISKMMGDLAGPCMFSVLMGLARVGYARFGNQMPLTRFLMLGGLLCIGAYLLASLAASPVLALAGCALCGLSVGIMWPGVFSLASAHFPKGGTAMFALLALAGDLGCSSGPTVVGMVSGFFGDQLRCGLLAAVLFPAVLVICALTLAKGDKRRAQ